MFRCSRYPLAMLMLAPCGLIRAEPAESESFDYRLARLFSGEVRSADRRLARLADEIDALPQLYSGPRGSRFGFHSETISNQSEPHYLQVDLLALYPIDSIVVVPALLPTRGAAGEGYGFPLRFKVEVSETPHQQDFRLVADCTEVDFENPRRYPVSFPASGKRGRFIRFTSTKHVPADNGFIWALEEIMVLSGNYNVAATRPRNATSHEELFPNWSIHRVNDGISRLGYPWNPVPSPTKGFLSAPSKSSFEGKWLIVDFGKQYPIDEVRLIPTTSDDPEVVGGRGFPTDLVLELSNDPEFGETLWRSTSIKNPLGHPWNSALVRPSGATKARYLRVFAKALFARGDQHSFALAEIQAFSNGQNIAHGRPVRVSDQTDQPADSGWAPEFAVDGFASDYRLAELPEFVNRVIERGALEKERESLLQQRSERIEFVSAGVTTGVGTLGGVAVFGWLWVVVRQRAVRRQDAERLREQIARDLHDDIGSNLGGIVLLSEAGSAHAGSDPQIKDDFREIKETAELTAESMQDIVWLIQVRNASLRDLLIKMRKSVEIILGDLPATIEIDPPDFRNRPLALSLRRQIFFAFKESLNNVRKHARAANVSIKIKIAPKSLSFAVADDGVGFDLESGRDSGLGLENLKGRASRVHGRCHIDSTPGRGTTITFTAPLKRKTK